MTDAVSPAEDPWAVRLRAHEQAVQTRNPEALRAAEEELRARLEKHGLSPAEAELLGQITMTLE